LKKEDDAGQKIDSEIDSNVLIPSNIFKDRNLAVLESLVEYLKDVRGFNFHEIGRLLNRDERNIWTVYSRSKKKRKNEKK